jgi:Zn-dependent protease with chaperone function
MPMPASPSPRLSVLHPGQRLDTKAVRHPTENAFLLPIVAVNLFAGAVAVATILQSDTATLAAVGGAVLGLYVFYQIGFHFVYWFLYGNSVIVSSTQYPELHRAVREACNYLEIRPTPSVMVTHGGGLLEVFLVKRFTKRGILIFTSEMVEATLSRGNSRELMMLVGRQLGHIRMGHFKGWFFKDVVGRFALWGHSAWKRRCHYTADRVGMLVAGDLASAQRGLIAITVGKALAEQTSIDALREQADELASRPFAVFRQLFLEYPYMIHRIIELENFGGMVAAYPPSPGAREVLAVLPPEANTFVVYGNAIFGSGNMMVASVTP